MQWHACCEEAPPVEEAAASKKRSRSAKIGGWRPGSRGAEQRSEAAGSGLARAEAVFPSRDIREGVERVVRVVSPRGDAASAGTAASATAGAATADTQAGAATAGGVAATAGSSDRTAAAGKGTGAAKAGRGEKVAAKAGAWLQVSPLVRDMSAAAV